MSDGFDLSPLKKALSSLEDILKQPKNKYIVAGTIQNFEFTFELSWKAMQRYLKLRGVETGSPNQVFRAALKEGIISDFEVWNEFLRFRNLTVHTYNLDVAEEVFLAAQKFPMYVHKIILKFES